MSWWIWIALGVVLFIAEVFLSADFWLVFFGVAALIVGFLGYSGMEMGGPTQWIVFTGLAVVGVFGLRGPIRRKLAAGGSEVGSDLIGKPATARGDIPAGARGKVDLRGSVWEAQNDGGAPIAAGDRCIVTGMTGVTLSVRPE